MRAKFPYSKRKKRLGCGIGSGHGKTSTKGHKGQRARSGCHIRPGFEGGQNPLYRRLPKRGFNNAAFREDYDVVNLDRLSELKDAEITPELLAARGIIKRADAILKILGDGEIKRAVTIKAHRFSKSAKTKIEKAGGQVIILEQKAEPTVPAA